MPTQSEDAQFQQLDMFSERGCDHSSCVTSYEQRLGRVLERLAGHEGSAARTEVGLREAKSKPSLLSKTIGFMLTYDFAINPYMGCAFGCSYCYAAFFASDRELQEHWGQWVTVKDSADATLLREFIRPRQRSVPHCTKLDGATIYMSSVTDPYQSIERELGLTRAILEIMADGHRPKLVVQTRSADVTRDIDLFQQIEANGGRVQVNMTVTTDNEGVRKQFEPSCPANQRRIDAIQQVHEAGVQACVTLTPMIWSDNPHAFAERLLETGVERFIIQPFKFTGGKFVAQTRDGALQLMAELLDCATHPKVIEREYMKRYRSALAIFKDLLPQLGEEKDGFAPPF